MATPAGWDGDDYQRRFDELRASGADVHGEARLVASLHPSSVLDAGCGTGRVGIELARMGAEVVGVDLDASMLAVARRQAPTVTWIQADMASVSLPRRFDVVVMAGNVPLFTPAGSQEGLVAGCGRALEPGGALVTGFQLNRGYDLATFDDHCALAGLMLVERWSTWDRRAWTSEDAYAVSIHRSQPSPVGV